MVPWGQIGPVALTMVALGAAVPADARRAVAQPGPASALQTTAAAADSARPVRDTRPSVFASLGIEWRADDNILRLTQRNLDRLSANPGSTRFLITTPDDNIGVLRAALRWRTRPLPRRETRVSGSADAFRYQTNGIANYEEYSLGVKQELTASKRWLATLELWSSLLPSYYLGQITDADDSFTAGRRIRRELRYRQTGAGARYGQELIPGRAGLVLGWEQWHRNYDSHFDERDNDNDQWRVAMQGQPFRRWNLEIGLLYVQGSLQARGDLATSPIRDADISYDHHGLGVQASLPWRYGHARGRLDATWMPEIRTYTTTDKFDLSRFGRVNHRRTLDVKVTQEIWGQLDAILSFNRLTSDATFGAGTGFTADETDFDATRYGLMLRGRWSFFRR